MAREDRAILRVTGRGIRKVERITQINEKHIRQVIQDAIQEVGEISVVIMQNHAPERTGHLIENIAIVGRNRSTSRPQIRVGINDVRSDKGFPYLNVTRFGRRAVEATRRSQPARTLRDSRDMRQKRPFRAAMLRFEPGEPGSGSRYRRRVAAYKPRRDWVAASTPEVKEFAREEFQTVTREIRDVLVSGSTRSRPVSVAVKSRSGRFR